MERPYLFVHINKTGGVSLWHILGATPIHRTAAELYSEYGPTEWKDITVFTIVRNPYDRAVSIYEARRKKNAQNILEDNLSFLEFLKRALVLKQQPYFNRAAMLSSQYSWLLNTRGKVVVPYIFSFENYEESIRQILQLIGRDRNKPKIIPRTKETNHDPWPTYYKGTEGRQAQEIILTEWADDFTYLNYPEEIPHGNP